jgi:hypothetical protein
VSTIEIVARIPRMSPSLAFQGNVGVNRPSKNARALAASCAISDLVLSQLPV